MLAPTTEFSGSRIFPETDFDSFNVLSFDNGAPNMSMQQSATVKESEQDAFFLKKYLHSFEKSGVKTHRTDDSLLNDEEDECGQLNRFRLPFQNDEDSLEQAEESVLE